MCEHCDVSTVNDLHYSHDVTPPSTHTHLHIPRSDLQYTWLTVLLVILGNTQILIKNREKYKKPPIKVYSFLNFDFKMLCFSSPLKCIFIFNTYLGILSQNGLFPNLNFFLWKYGCNTVYLFTINSPDSLSIISVYSFL